MFVVKRPFKSFGKCYVAGDIIKNPATIKLFSTKLAEGKILEVTPENEKSYAEYFQLKYGVDILPTDKGTMVKESDAADSEPKVALAKPSVAKVSTVKIVAK